MGVRPFLVGFNPLSLSLETSAADWIDLASRGRMSSMAIHFMTTDARALLAEFDASITQNHGHLLETFLNHFDNSFTYGFASAMHEPSDLVSSREAYLL